jgi:hypothetical protein
MASSNHPMRWGTSDRTWSHTLRAALGALLLVGCPSVAHAQYASPASVSEQNASSLSVPEQPDTPPLGVPPSGTLPATPGDALTAGGWLFYPSVRTYTQYTDNLFQSVLSPVSVWGFGIQPGLIAEWSNGIHTTTLYGNVDTRKYPTANQYNVFDPKAGFIQKYEPLPDLTFRVQGDYTHQTLTSSFVNAIPGALGSPGTTILPNGNTLLPNGLIISPTGVVVGQGTPSATAANSTILLNPSNQFTGTASVDKILNRGFIGLSGLISRTDYENTNITQDFTTKALTGKGSIWLGPVFYAYADASYAAYTYTASGTSPATSPTTAYRAVGGIGTRQIGLFSASAYYGHQGTAIEGSGTAGGEVYGGRLNYYPTPIWTIGIGVDETVNVSNETGVTNLALNNQAPSALVIPVTESARTTAASLNSSYQFSKQWSAIGTFGYSHVVYLETPEVDNSWLADVILQYQIWKNMTLNWEYRYSSIISNVPLNSSKSNFVAMSATYKY